MSFELGLKDRHLPGLKKKNQEARHSEQREDHMQRHRAMPGFWGQ